MSNPNRFEELPEKRERLISVRLTEEEYECVKRNAELANLRVAVYARHAILGCKLNVTMPIVLDPKGMEPAVAALGRAGGNLNQIAHWLNWHTSASDELRAEVSAAAAEVADCARLLTELATRGVDAGVEAWRSLSTSL